MNFYHVYNHNLYRLVHNLISSNFKTILSKKNLFYWELMNYCFTEDSNLGNGWVLISFGIEFQILTP